MSSDELARTQPDSQDLPSDNEDSPASDIQVGLIPSPIMQTVRDIVAEDPLREVWRRLRYFLDERYTVDHIDKAQNVDMHRYGRDVRKQAQQLAYCIRQAEEYFSSSSQVDIPTRPVLLYYGAVSLSRAIILLRKNGDYSFDRLRQMQKHHHHGLEFGRGSIPSESVAPGPLDFLRALHCHLHEQTGQPWGNFPLLYQSLIPSSVRLDSDIIVPARSFNLRRTFPQTSVDLPPIDELRERNMSLLELVETLPDAYWLLRDFNCASGLCRGSETIQVLEHHELQPDGIWQRKSVEQTLEYYLDGMTSQQRETLIRFTMSQDPSIEIIFDAGSNVGLRQRYAMNAQEPDQRIPHRYHLDVLEDIHGRLYFIIDPKSYVPEIASMLIVLFSFSMMARYYPDIWMAHMDRRARTREFIDYLLNICYRKFPNLVLDQLTTTKHYVHT